MDNEKRTVCFDNDLKIEAYHFEGIMQKFPNHFHEHYVIGFVAKEITGTDYLPIFTSTVICQSDAVPTLRDLHVDLSKVFGLNKHTLLRDFTMQRGITPYQYLSTIRVSKAKKLLEAGISPVEAALQSGFADQSHFTRFFKTFIGLTPKLYQDIFNEDPEQKKRRD